MPNVRPFEAVRCASTLLVTLCAGAAAAPDEPLPSAVVQAQVESYNRGDAAGFAASYSDDVEVFDLGPDSKPTLRGRAALLALYEPMFNRYHPQATILSRIESGHFVIDKEQTTAAGHSHVGVAIYQVENGKIRRVWFTP